MKIDVEKEFKHFILSYLVGSKNYTKLDIEKARQDFVKNITEKLDNYTSVRSINNEELIKMMDLANKFNKNKFKNLSLEDKKYVLSMMTTYKSLDSSVYDIEEVQSYVNKIVKSDNLFLLGSPIFKFDYSSKNEKVKSIKRVRFKSFDKLMDFIDKQEEIYVFNLEIDKTNDDIMFELGHWIEDYGTEDVGDMTSPLPSFLGVTPKYVDIKKEGEDNDEG